MALIHYKFIFLKRGQSESCRRHGEKDSKNRYERETFDS